MGTAQTTKTKDSLKPHEVSYYLSYLRSLLFTNLLIYIYTAVCGTLSLFASLFDSSGRWQHAFARLWSRLILTTSGIRTRVEGVENLDTRKAAVYCANHQSAMDIPILFVHLPVQFRFVAKRSLFKIPFMGWHLKRSGHIPVDRGRPREARKGLDKAAERIRAGSSVILFPEGHRSRDGKIGPFKSGSFYLAIQAGTPVVPITLNGTRAVLKPDTYHIRPGQTEMIVHPPIPTTELKLQDVEALSANVRAQILSRFVPSDE
jgi:1-acyl-sn-glycerol-3-phosphate acyltransferase